MHDLTRIPSGFTKRHTKRHKPAAPLPLTCDESPAQAIAAGICTVLLIAALYTILRLFS